MGSCLEIGYGIAEGLAAGVICEGLASLLYSIARVEHRSALLRFRAAPAYLLLPLD